MKKALFAAALFLASSVPAFAADIAAVRIHADWCPNCKALDPKLATVEAALDDDVTVRFVRLDYTNRDKGALWAAAEKEGLKEVLKEYTGGKIKTGLLLLVNEDTNEVVGKEKSSATETELRNALLAAASL